MTEVTIKGHKIVFYDNIKKTPIRRYQQSNKYLMIASDIGSDFSDFDRKTGRVIEFLKKGMLTEAVGEMENRRQTVWNAYKNYVPTGMAFALLIHSINGKLKDDISDDGLEKTLDQLDKIGVTYEDMMNNLTDVKKKSKFNLKHILSIIFQGTTIHNTTHI